jgi:hypothetical protein
MEGEILTMNKLSKKMMLISLIEEIKKILRNLNQKKRKIKEEKIVQLYMILISKDKLKRLQTIET